MDSAINLLPFHRIILNIYIVYLEETLPYKSLIKSLVSVFETSLNRARTVSKDEFSFTLGMYTKIMRIVSKDISIIFKVEKK